MMCNGGPDKNMDVTGNIAIITFSAALTQEDCINGRNRGIMYYSVQKGRLVEYLRSIFINKQISINIIGLNTKLKYDSKLENDLKYIRLPNPDTNHITQSIIFGVNCFLYLLFHRPLAVYAYTDGLLYPYLGALFYSKISRTPFFLDLRNPAYSTYIDKSAPIHKRIGVNVSDQLCMRYCDKIIHISANAKELLRPKLYLFQKSIIVPSCASPVFFNTFKKENKKDELILCTWGVIDKQRRLDIVIQAFARAKKMNENFNAKYYIVGDGPELEPLKELAGSLKLKHIFFTGYMRENELAIFLQNISVAVIPIPPDKFYYQCSSPLKLAEAIAIEIPIIASNIRPNKIVTEYNIGILCDHDVDSYAQSFLRFWGLSELELNAFRMNCKGIKYLFSQEYVFREVGNAISEILQQRQTRYNNR